jgi:hypothetical protein
MFSDANASIRKNIYKKYVKDKKPPYLHAKSTQKEAKKAITPSN